MGGKAYSYHSDESEHATKGSSQYHPQSHKADLQTKEDPKACFICGPR